jgi:hypothetical protein
MEPAGYVRDIDVFYELFVWSLGLLLDLRPLMWEMVKTHHFPSAKSLPHITIDLNLLDEASHHYATKYRT